MQRPNPMVQVMGGGALFTVAGMIHGTKLPELARYPAMAVCALMGLASIGLGLHAAFFRRKPERPNVKLRSSAVRDDGLPALRDAPSARANPSERDRREP